MNTQIFWPILAHMLLTILLYFLLAARKSKAVKAGVDRSKTALDINAWPDNVIKVSNNIDNQFQLPILFYALFLILFSLNAVNTVVLVLAWVFVLSRYFHTYIHINSNYVPKRMVSFVIGAMILLSMIIYTAWTLANL